jgi:hypothetical protein
MSKVSKLAIAAISLFVLLLALLLAIYAVSFWRSAAAPLDSLTLTIVAAACIVTVVYLNRGRLWAWWSALVVAAMVLAFGAFCIFCAFYPITIFEQTERSFLLMAGLVFGVPAAITGVLLNIPPVRRGFQQ